MRSCRSPEHQCRADHRDLLGGRSVASPAAYCRQAGRNDPNPNPRAAICWPARFVPDPEIDRYFKLADADQRAADVPAVPLILVAVRDVAEAAIARAVLMLEDDDD